MNSSVNDSDDNSEHSPYDYQDSGGGHNVLETVSNKTPSERQSPDVTPKQLLDALDAQIKIEADRQRNDGWTRWAIWGALATLVWIATDLCFDSTLTWSNAVAVALLIFISWKLIEQIRWIILPNSRFDQSPGRFWRASDTIRPLAPTLAFSVVQYSLILILLLSSKFPPQWFLAAYAVVALLVSLFMVIAHTLVVGVPVGVTLKVTVTVLTVLQVLWLIVACWQIGSFVHSEFGSIGVVDVRLAVVLNAGAFLISRLVNEIPSEHRLGKLCHLRQDIAFARVPSETAAADAEALLSGVTLTEILQPLVHEILTEERKLQTVIAETEKTLNLVDQKLLDQEQQPGEVLQMIDSIGSPPTNLIRQIKRNKRAWSRFVGQTIAFTLYLPESKMEAKAITDEVHQKLDDVKSRLTKCMNLYSALKEQVHLEATSQVDRLVRQLG